LRSSSRRASSRRATPVAELGPDLLGEAFDRDEAIRRIVASGHRAIAPTLLDQRIVAGIGNVYKSEVLFLSGVHPETPSSAVPLALLERMMDIARGLLRDNVIDGTSPSIQTYRNLRQWNPASEHDESLWVYGRPRQAVQKMRHADRDEEDGYRSPLHLLVPSMPTASQ
jgi:endonuclease-8